MAILGRRRNRNGRVFVSRGQMLLVSKGPDHLTGQGLTVTIQKKKGKKKKSHYDQLPIFAFLRPFPGGWRLMKIRIWVTQPMILEVPFASLSKREEEAPSG